MVNKLLVGKVDDNFNWLPLWVHLQDTAGVMKLLLENWIADATVESCGMQFETFYAIAEFVAATHDIGKATSYFQAIICKKVPILYDNIVSSGLIVCENMLHRGKTPHSYAGQWILQSDTVSINLPESVANVIGAHHGAPCPRKTLNGVDDLLVVYPSNFYGEEDDSSIQSMQWQSIWNEIVNEALMLSGFDSISEVPDLTVDAQVLLSGLLIVADWIASNTRLFPLIGLDDDFEKIDCDTRVAEGWNRLQFPEEWHSEVCNMSKQIFQERFGFEPNAVQEAVIKAINETNTPGIFILEAQMGIGKTEAALGAAEVIASKCNSKGIFFGLPTQATCNGLYDRLYEWASSVSDETVNAIRLAHGGANYNKNYQQQVIQGKTYVYEEEIDSSVYVHPWFQGNKKALLADFVIGTVDQFLMASLRRKHFMLRHLGLSGKVVIIDECHAYDAYMNQYLEQSIEWMAGYGVPVILLSATLPLSRRKELVNRYIKGIRRNSPKTENQKNPVSGDWMDNISYPLLTWTDGLEVHQCNILQQTQNRNVKMNYLHGVEQTVGLLKEKLCDGGCACVILNTIRHAQEYYRVIKDLIKDAEVLLYHAQFTMEHRLEKEEILLERMGKKSSDQKRNRFILIGTQVLEQSLDYDADILITELCPMDLLLQRIGRLHRHNRCDATHHYSRPKRLQQAECYVLLEAISDGESGLYDKGSQMIYGDYLLIRTLNILPSEIVIPKDIPTLVQRVYDEKDDCDLDITDVRYLQAKEDFIVKKGKKRNNAKAFLLKYPRKTIQGMLTNEYLDKTQKGNMSVRDIESSIEVIIMKRYEQNKIGFVCSDTGNSIRMFDCNFLSEEDGVEIARQRLYLPRLFANPGLLYRAIDELEKMQYEMSVWQRNPWLQGELILLLDADNTAQLCGYDLHYDFELGLVVEKEDKNG